MSTRSSIISVVRSLIYYLRYQQTTVPQGDVEELLAVAYQSDVVLFALSIAVYNYLGIKISLGVRVADIALQVVEAVVKQAVTNGEVIISSAINVLALITDTGALNLTEDASVDELQNLIGSK
ncbi:hypothetical protein G195_006989 [Phytophthora kernoviae 00238/432]|uniref:Uncharacterized protein n=1 Tax=Phytophthora kernoviae 00238/432 TaxID=1284355 RepID=A0A8J4S5V9_9STRA|nr:hypothetical protein G195_006989 [Phytophthora kernoviae 00238/432]